MSRFGSLQVGHWAAILADGEAAAFGCALAEDAIPAALRRRMGHLERLAARCTLGVLQSAPATDELVFASRYGNLETLCGLLRSIALEEPMSPMGFSGSVHNAAPGLVGQIRKERLAHTAIAAGQHTFAAGLTEAYARLATGDCADVTFTYADTALPEIYRPLSSESHVTFALAMRLTLARESGGAIDARPGVEGAIGVFEGLRAGLQRLGIDFVSHRELIP